MNLDIKRRWEGFWQIADPKIWVASTIPMIVGGSLAFYITNSFDFFWFFISLFGIYLIEIGKNAINECVDFKSGVDLFVTADKRTPFSGGKKTIIDNKLTFFENAIIGFVTIGLSALVGIFVVYFREPKVIWIGLLGLFFALFYSLPPFKFSYRGIGEFVVGFTFGILITSGIYLVLTKNFSFVPVVAGLPFAFLIANVLLINEFPDYEADKKGNKRNLVVRFGKKKSVVIYALFYSGAYLSFIFSSLYFRNPLFLITLVTLPMAIKSINNAKINYDNIQDLVKSNALTVTIYQITGLLFTLVLLISRFLNIFLFK